MTGPRADRWPPRAQRAGAALYRALYEESPIAIELFAADGRLVSVNRACLELFGVLDDTELVDFDLFADPNIADDQKERLRHGESVRYSAPFDFETVRRLGLYRTSRHGTAWLDVRITPLRAAGVGYLAQIQDITAQRQAHEELRLATARLEATLNAAPDLVFRVDRCGRILEAHTMAASQYYVPPAAFLGKTLPEVLPADVTHVAMAALEDAAAHGVHRGAVYSLAMPPGVRWYELAVAPVGGPPTPAGEFVVLARDITERHEAEEALRRRVAELDALRRMSELLVQRVDLSGALQSAAHVLRGLFAARMCEVRLAVEERAQPGRPAAEAVAEHGGHVFTVPLVAHGETLGTLVVERDTQHGPFGPDEEALARTAAGLVAGVIRSERLHLAEKEEAAGEERRRIARDLHDSVTHSIHAANMLAATLPTSWERSPDEGRENTRAIQQLLRAAFAELRILLYELRPETLAAAPLDTLLERLRDALAGRSATAVGLAIEPGLDLPQDVRLAFYRVAQEALNNIIKYADARHAAVTVASTDGEARLTIADDGHGFDPGAIPAGMGLGIMRERAESIGARLTVASAPGAGTTVTLVWSPPAAAARSDGSRDARHPVLP